MIFQDMNVRRVLAARSMQCSFDQQIQEDHKDKDENKQVVEQKNGETHWNGENTAVAVPPVVQGFVNGRALQGRGIRDHTKKDPSLKCERCKKTFCLKKSLLRHTKTAACVEKGEGYKIPRAQPVVCPKCGTCFKDRSTMRKHIKKVHLKTKSHSCHQCVKAFFDRTNLKRHIETVHIRSIHFCEFCTRTFTCSSYLIDHVKREHSETSVQCKNCKKNFIQQKNLNLHLVNGICEEERIGYIEEKKKVCLKTKSIPFHCPECGKKSLNKANLVKHLSWVHSKFEKVPGLSEDLKSCQLYKSFKAGQNHVAKDENIATQMSLEVRKVTKENISCSNNGEVITIPEKKDDKYLQEKSWKKLQMRTFKNSRENTQMSDLKPEKVEIQSNSKDVNHMEKVTTTDIVEEKNKRETTHEQMEAVVNNQYLGLCNICQAILLSQKSFQNHIKKHGKKTVNPQSSKPKEEANLEVTKPNKNICIKCSYCHTVFLNNMQLERHWFRRRYCCLQYNAVSEPVTEYTDW